MCASCHKAGAVGASYAPDLTASKLNRREILEAISGHHARSTRNTTRPYRNDRRANIRGLLLSDAGGGLRLKTAEAAQPVDIQKAQVKAQRKEAMSIMPELFDKMANNEFSEIVAFVQSSDKTPGGRFTYTE